MTPAWLLSPLLRYGAAAGAGFFIAWSWQSHSMDAERGRNATESAAVVVQQVNEIRQFEQRAQAGVDQASEVGDEQIQQARADAGAAAGAADRLQKHADDLSARLASCNSGTASERAARERDAMVFSDMLRWADQRAGELAAAYDSARARGLTCERSYRALEQHLQAR
jgi:hypothetical protein